MNLICPICRKPTDAAVHPDFPFCSARCRLLDLGNWSSERYVVAEPVFTESPAEPHKPDESES